MLVAHFSYWCSQDLDKAKAALDTMGEKGVADAKAALEKGDVQGALAGAMGSLGGGSK